MAEQSWASVPTPDGGHLRAIAASFSPSAVSVVEVAAARREVLSAEFPGVVVRAEGPACGAAVVAVLDLRAARGGLRRVA